MAKTWPVLLTLLFFYKGFSNPTTETQTPVEPFFIVNSSTESEITNEISVFPGEKYTSCSSGWFQFGDMCYKLGLKMNISIWNSWTNASQICREEYNGNLITITSKELNDFITAFMVLSIRNNVWIGLHKKMSDSAYIWDDGSSYTPLQRPWSRSEYFNDREECIKLGFTFRLATTAEWISENCERSQAFVCQRKKEKFSKRNLDPRFCSSDVGGGWKHETSCFNFVPEKKSWAEAEEYCIQNFQGHLATIPDIAVNLFLNYILRDKKNDLWIGYRYKNEHQKQWSSGWQVAFENWAEGEEFDAFDKGSCAARNSEGKWVKWSCIKTLPFLCEYSTAKVPTLTPRAGGSCPELRISQRQVYHEENYTEWRDLGGDYCYIFEVRKPYSQFRANNECRRKGGNLVSIHSEEEAVILNNFIKNAEVSFLIGLQRSYDGKFKWTDGSPLDFEMWNPGEPSQKDDNCVEVLVHNFLWNDISCYIKRGYICSIQKDFSNSTNETPLEPFFTRVPTLTPRAESSSCPELPGKWIDLGGDYCYYFDIRSSVTWYEANFLCLRRGSNLVSIHSQKEANALNAAIEYTAFNFHIGLHRSAINDEEFVWTDGSPLDFEMWNPGQPGRKDDKCVEVLVDNFLWNDIWCGLRQRYICSIQKDFSNPATEMQTPMEPFVSMEPFVNFSNSTTETQTPVEPCSSAFSSNVLIGVICVLVVVILIRVLFYFFRLRGRRYEKVEMTCVELKSAVDQRHRYRPEIIVTGDVNEGIY